MTKVIVAAVWKGVLASRDRPFKRDAYSIASSNHDVENFVPDDDGV